MRYQLDRIEHKDGTITYEMPKKGKAYNDNLIISTQLAILSSEHTTRQLFTPGNFEEPKRLGYTIKYIQQQIQEAQELGKDYNIQDFYDKAATMNNDQLKDATKVKSNLIYNNIQSQFHKQNMVAGQLIGVFAQANVSHAFLGLAEGTALLLGQNGIEFTFDGKLVGGEYMIDNIYSNDGITYQSNILASLLAASVDAVKDPILNLANINLDTVNIVTSMIRLGFSLEQVVLLLNQPIVQKLVRDLGVQNANNKNKGKTYHTDLSSVIDAAIEELGITEEELNNITNISITSEALINNLDGKDAVTNYMVLNIIQQLFRISEAFSDIQHMTRYNSISSAVGPSTTDTMLNRIKDDIFLRNELINSNIHRACGYSEFERGNPILESFRNSANYLERMILGNNMIQADNDFFESLQAVGTAAGFKKGLPQDIAQKFTDFYMSYYVNTGITGSTFDLSKERREFMIKEFPTYFQSIKSNYTDNPFISAIILKTSSTEDFPFLSIKTRGLSSEDIEDLKQGWATLYNNGGEQRNLAMALVEYNFFRGGFGFNPKTFTNLIPNVIKQNIPNYINTLNNKSSSMNRQGSYYSLSSVQAMQVQFLLHNPEIIRDKYYNINLYNPQPQEDGSILINVVPDSTKSKSKYPPKIIGDFTSFGWTLKTPIIIIDGKAYYVETRQVESASTILQISITPTDFLGGNGQGYEIELNKLLPKSIYPQPNVKDYNLASQSKALNQEEIQILMANLFEVEEMSTVIKPKKQGGIIAESVIERINRRLEERGIKYSMYSSRQNISSINKIVKNIKEALKDNQSLNEVLNSANKTLADLNLCS